MTRLFKPLILVGALLAGGVFAQESMPMAGHDAMMGQQGHATMHTRDPAKMAAMVAKHLAALKTSLKISADQEGAWSTFAEAMKPPANMRPAHPDRAEMDKLSTPERIDKMHALRAEHMAAMSAEMDKRDNAIKAFYTALTTEQKKVFDADHARMSERMEHMVHGDAASGVKK